MSNRLQDPVRRDAEAGRRDRLGLRLLAALLVALTGLIAVPGAARADWSVVGDTVPSGQVIDNDVLVTGRDVVIDGIVTLLGLGAIWLAYRQHKSTPQAVGVDEPVQPALTLEC